MERKGRERSGRGRKGRGRGGREEVERAIIITVMLCATNQFTSASPSLIELPSQSCHEEWVHHTVTLC